MRKVYEVGAVILAGALGMAPAMQAQTPAPVPVSNPAAPAAAGNGQQGQMESQAMSPEAQMKLAKKVYHAIMMLPYYSDDPFDYLTFGLQGRTVILEGAVLRATLKPDAEKAVKKVEGVDKVVNNIEVLPPGQIDMRIRKQVQSSIYGYGPFMKYANQPNPPIRIIVKGARVTLEGVVDTEVDKGQATMRANLVRDVLTVTNNLRVVKP
jgi:hyperosmotically inducible periplasmic protein